jgi:predicted RNA-binding Zn-ribbon protein involved in translation (DUF1610 family)
MKPKKEIDKFMNRCIISYYCTSKSCSVKLRIELDLKYLFCPHCGEKIEW